MLPAPDVPPRTPRAGDERTLLCAQLDDKQTILLRKVAGLSEDDLRRTPTASAISLLGLLKHSAYTHRWWFRRVFAGEEVTLPYTDDDPDADWRVEAEESAQRCTSMRSSAPERSSPRPTSTTLRVCRPASPPRSGASSCTWSRRPHGISVTRTSSARRSTAPPATEWP